MRAAEIAVYQWDDSAAPGSSTLSRRSTSPSWWDQGDRRSDQAEAVQRAQVESLPRGSHGGALTRR
jgi:hypothetical protein